VHKSFAHLLGGTNRDVIELPMNRVDANYFKRKGDDRVIKNEKDQPETIHFIEATS